MAVTSTIIQQNAIPISAVSPAFFTSCCFFLGRAVGDGKLDRC